MAKDILVVDDETVITDAVLRICAAEGFTCAKAEDCAQGLASIDREAYRLILCDIMMPGLDGFQLLAELSRRRIRTPVIVVSGYSTLENAVRSLSCGAIDFLPKPFTADELLSAVARGLAYEELLRVAAPGGEPPATHPPTGFHRLGHVSWADIEPAGTARIGICDLFLRTVAGLSKIQLLQAGEDVAQGRSCAQVVSHAGVTHGLMSPLTGRILEVNGAAASGVAVERGTYSGGWLYRILPSDLEYDLKHLIRCDEDRA